MATTHETYKYVVWTEFDRRKVVELARTLFADLKTHRIKLKTTKFNPGTNPVLSIKTTPYMLLDEESFKRDMEEQGITLVPLGADYDHLVP